MLTTIRATARRSITTYASQFGAVDVPNASFTQFVADKVAAHDPAKAMLTCGLSGKTLTFGEFAPRVAAAAAKLEVKDADASHVLTVGPFESVVTEAAALAGGKATVGVLGDGDFVDFAGFDAAAAPAPDFSSTARRAPPRRRRGAVGVMLTHGNIVANLIQTVAMVERARPDLCTKDDTLLGLLPMFHIYGMITILHFSMIYGTTLVTLPNFEPESFLKTIAQHQVSVAHLVPPSSSSSRSTRRETEMIDSLRCIMSGAAPLDEHTQKEAAERIGASVLQGYGMTETSPVLTMDDGDHFGSAGKLIPSTEAALMVPDGESYRDAALGEEGELWCRGPQVMPGYLNRPDANAETLTDDGFVKTGDVAKIDADGNLFIVDRVKELIKVKGLQLDADASAIDLTNFVAEKVAVYKQIQAVTFVDEIPKSASGKILRRVLKERFE
ncbi:ligase [Aureococcus anophagefferens]|nr:ligase [Aureococcus anophagefferens]